MALGLLGIQSLVQRHQAEIDALKSRMNRLIDRGGNLRLDGSTVGVIQIHDHTGTGEGGTIAATHPQAHAAADHNAATLPASANENLGAFYIDIDDIAVPANPGAGIRRLFVDTATGEISVRTNAGATVSLEGTGGVHNQSHDHSLAGDGQTLQAVDYKLPAATELTIAAGVITATQSHHTIDTEADADTDDLDTINGLAANQWYLFRPADGARTTVIKHGTGNIFCFGNADITLDDVHDFFWAISPDGVNVYALGGGEGGYSESNICGTDLTPLSTSNQDVPDCSVTLPTPGTYIVIGVFNFFASVAGGAADDFLGVLTNASDVEETGVVGWADVPVAVLGNSVSFTWRVTTTTSNEVYKLRARRNGTTGTFQVLKTLTTILAFSIPGGGIGTGKSSKSIIFGSPSEDLVVEDWLPDQAVRVPASSKRGDWTPGTVYVRVGTVGTGTNTVLFRTSTTLTGARTTRATVNLGTAREASAAITWTPADGEYMWVAVSAVGATAPKHGVAQVDIEETVYS